MKTPTEESGRRARGRRFACTGSHVGNFPQGGWNIAYNPDCPAQRSIAAATHRNAACVRASVKRTRIYRRGLGIGLDGYGVVSAPANPTIEAIHSRAVRPCFDYEQVRGWHINATSRRVR